MHLSFNLSLVSTQDKSKSFSEDPDPEARRRAQALASFEEFKAMAGCSQQLGIPTKTLIKLFSEMYEIVVRMLSATSCIQWMWLKVTSFIQAVWESIFFSYRIEILPFLLCWCLPLCMQQVLREPVNWQWVSRESAGFIAACRQTNLRRRRGWGGMITCDEEWMMRCLVEVLAFISHLLGLIQH